MKRFLKIVNLAFAASNAGLCLLLLSLDQRGPATVCFVIALFCFFVGVASEG